MNTHFVKIISGIALLAGFTQSSLVSSDENTDTCLPVNTKTRALTYKIQAIDLTSKVQPMIHAKEILSDRKTKGLANLSSTQSFLTYQINGQSFTNTFRVKNRVFCSVADVKKTLIPAVTGIDDKQK